MGIAAALLTGSSSAASSLAETVSVFQATLLEPNHKTAEVSTDELRQVLQDNSAVVFDSRPHIEYAVSHIPGALNVALVASISVQDVAALERNL